MWSSAAESHLLQHCVQICSFAYFGCIVANSGPDTNVTVLLNNLFQLNKVRHEQDLFQQFLILVLFLNRLHGPQLKIILVL